MIGREEVEEEEKRKAEKEKTCLDKQKILM